MLNLQLEITLPSLAGCCEGTYISSGWVFRYGNDERIEGIRDLEPVPVPRLGVFSAGCKPLAAWCLMRTELYHLVDTF